MNKRSWSRGEKWMIAVSCGVCLPGLLLGWIYEHQNELPPAPVIELEVPPANNAFDVLMATLPSLTKPAVARWVKGGCKATGAEVDREFACGVLMQPYTPQYNRAFPLKNKLAYLRANRSALKTWRASLSLPLYVSDDLPLAQKRLWRRQGAFAVLARTQARACWQQGDNDSALGWLLAWHRDLCRQTLSFYNGRNHPVTLDSLRNSDYSRREVGDELKWLMPFLNATQLRRASLELQRNRSLIPSRAEAAREGKKKWMPRVYRACAANNFKGFDVEFSVSWVDSLWKQRFRWANKKAGFARIEKQWDWSIAGEEAPLQTTDHQIAPQPNLEENDPFRLLQPYLSNLQRVSAASSDASELVLITAMAARSFALEHGHNPRNLDELVPIYLQEVEADPFNAPHPLQYSPKPKTFTTVGLLKPLYTLPLPKNAMAVPPPPFGNVAGQRIVTGYSPVSLSRIVPFLLYSVGANGHEDGGLYEGVSLQPIGTGKDDIVAQPEWFKLPK